MPASGIVDVQDLVIRGKGQAVGAAKIPANQGYSAQVGGHLVYAVEV